MKTTLDGIFLPLTTPFEGDALLLDEFTENIRMYESFEPTGYLVPGTTGESVSLSDEEAVLLIETARATSPDRTLIAGASRESTRDTVEACKAAADAGADAVLVRPPVFFRSALDTAALDCFYRHVADGSPVPVLLYNIPSHSGTVLDGGLVLSLLRHPNVAGVKDSSGSLTLLGEVAPDLESRHTFLMGAGSVLLPGLLLGARGGILALADAAPAQCIALYNLYRDGRLEEALGLQRGLTALDKAITRTYGIAGLKHALDLLGFHGGPPREPLLPLNDAGRADLAVLLRKLGLLR
jgi:4-hydroxy-2-oxoglutarate aldolase